ncbi:hypothetical protein HMPREF0970_00325 [Schaalia odontolytica F0309]|uniref:Uncharacterized protein n=1 Tax=Schaalia odontolytica F0309 TaxID=649742 RepID=D4TWL5_9ACTO|nr:hypothetical protein HMPREF0970_00325 [Schaalia odontolytica F0309]
MRSQPFMSNISLFRVFGYPYDPFSQHMSADSPVSAQVVAYLALSRKLGIT